jgi:hypothetical protein
VGGGKVRGRGLITRKYCVPFLLPMSTRVGSSSPELLSKYEHLFGLNC